MDTRTESAAIAADFAVLSIMAWNHCPRWMEYSLNRALEHATIAGEKYNEGEVSEQVFTNRYGRPLTYDGLRAAMRIAGNEIPLRQIRALAESHMPGTLGHLGQMRKIYTRTVRKHSSMRVG